MHLVPLVDGRRQRNNRLGCQTSFHDAEIKIEKSACQGMVWGGLSEIYLASFLMARNLEVGETVFVPKERLKISSAEGSALKECQVVATNRRTITVDVNDANGNGLTIASSAAHRNVHILVVRVGDFQTEQSFLDPLTKSILQYLRVLLTDDFVTRVEVRSLQEFSSFWQRNHAAFSHLVLVGHGSPAGLGFGVGGLATAQELVGALEVQNCTGKTIVSLACETGKGEIARAISSSVVCRGYLGPYSTVHGADASLFVQTFLNMHLLEGLTLRVATKRTYSVLSRCYFRLWQNGLLREGFHVKKPAADTQA